MQRILIPTDFSTVADNALNYAIEIASKFNSELYLCHVYHIHKIDYDLNFTDDEQPYKKEVERRMDLTKRKFIGKITQKGLSIHTIVEEDSITSLFSRKVKKHSIDLIVMGSKGASGLEKMVIGSVAATALEIAKVPVLVVPPKHSFLPFKQIVFANDQKEVPASALLPIQKLASNFDAEVTILNVNTGSGKATQQKNNVHLEEVETTYHEIPLSKSINESINDFVKKNQFDLMCMIRREKGFFEKIFKKSITKTQVYHSEIPLLVIPAVDH